MATVTVFTFDGASICFDDDATSSIPSLDVPLHIEAQHTSGISTGDEIKIRRLTVPAGGAPSGIDPPLWLRFTMSFKEILNILLDRRNGDLDELQGLAREAWEHRNEGNRVRIVSVSEAS